MTGQLTTATSPRDTTPPATGGVRVQAMAAGDWPAVRHIWAAGIATGHATFEAEPPTWEAFDAGKSPDHRLVARDEFGQVLGWAAVSPT